MVSFSRAVYSSAWEESLDSDLSYKALKSITGVHRRPGYVVSNACEETLQAREVSAQCWDMGLQGCSVQYVATSHVWLFN